MKTEYPSLRLSSRLSWAAFFALFFCITAPAGNSAADINDQIEWSSPESLDPRRENIGDFLDTDMNQYEDAAVRLYHEKY